MPSTLNLHRAVCQLCLKETKKGKEKDEGEDETGKIFSNIIKKEDPLRTRKCLAFCCMFGTA